MTQIPDLQPGEAVAVDWTAAEYFADHEAATRSGLALLAEDPAEFRRRELEGSKDDDRAGSMRFGTWAHLALLEPLEWIRRVGVPEPPRPEGANGSAKKGTEPRIAYETWKSRCRIRAEVLAKHPDSIDVTKKDFDAINEIAEAIREHPEAMALLGAEGPTEQTVLWREPTTGILVKVRIDKLARIDYATSVMLDGRLRAGYSVTDLKTTEDHKARGFSRSVKRYGYRAQAAIYLDAAQALLPNERVEFHFVAARNVKPHRVAVYRADEALLAYGRRVYQARLLELAERRRTNSWIADCESGVNTLTL